MHTYTHAECNDTNFFSSESQPNNSLTVLTKSKAKKKKNHHQMLLKLDLQETTSDQVPYST